MEKARATFAAQQNKLTDVDVARLQAVAGVRHAEALQRLRQQGHNGHRGQKLSATLDEWVRIKELDGRVGADRIRAVRRLFKRFIQVVGNRTIDSLTASDFRTWREWVSVESKRRRCGKWANDMHAVVKAVVRAVRRRNPDWPCPT